ncbi:MAG TPA: hypothetical protein VFP91_02430 [Vicinamibacterales bacterium]|nr:hypothetical protein [Vicinamibacterales bacterium]
METHVKVLGILQIVGGALGLLSALVVLLVFGGVVATVSGDADAATAIPVIGLTGTAVVVFLACWSLPLVIIGSGVYRIRPWARVWGIVVSVVSLIAFPFGTMLGVYGLWVLFSNEGEQLFAQRAVART